jgi:DNA-binding winged helix-turn-helix (wHTH) protein
MDRPNVAHNFRLRISVSNAGGCFKLDKDGVAEPVPLGSRALDLLLLRAGRQGEVVAKDAIMQTVWAHTAVEEANLTVQISALRRILDRHRAQGSCIQTVPGRGYRFARTEPFWRVLIAAMTQYPPEALSARSGEKRQHCMIN